MIYRGIVTRHFLNIFTRVMALDLRRNFVSSQYLENYLTYFHQILYMHLYWQDLAWDGYTSFFGNYYQSYCPLFFPKISFPLNILDPVGRISPNFIYAYILARSSLGLLHIILGKFALELWPLIYTKIWFLLYILRITWHIFTKFYICIHID